MNERFRCAVHVLRMFSLISFNNKWLVKLNSGLFYPYTRLYKWCMGTEIILLSNMAC